MADIILIIPILVSFFLSLIFMPFWMQKAKHIGLVWKDMNKLSKEKIPGSGGIVTIIALVIGILLFVAYRTFILQSEMFLVEILAIISVILFLFSIGLIDDLIGWRAGGLRKRHRIILVALAAIPLMAINAGKSQVGLPIFGTVELGIVYPLIIIPLGIVGAVTTYNFLAGFNGLEASQGIILISSLGLVAFFTGNAWLTVIAFIAVAALAGFLTYNFYPAKIFPGDSLTYPIGGIIAILAIVGNFEKIAMFFFIPYIIEFVLKSRGKLVKHSFGKPKKDGSLDLNYGGKVYSLNHLAILTMKKLGVKATEKRVVYAILTFQILIIIAGFIIFGGNIF